MASRSHLARLTAAAFVAGTVLALSAGPAVAETRAELTGQDIRGERFHFDSRVDNVGDHSETDLFGLRAGEDVLRTYCVEVSQSIKQNAKYVEVPWDRYPGRFAKPGKVLWVLNNGYPRTSPETLAERAGLPGLTKGEALAATQGAVWHFSNEVGQNERRNPPNVAALYRYLVDNARDQAQPKPSLEIDDSAARGHSGELIGPYVIHSSTRGKVDVSVTGNGDVTLVNKDREPVSRAADGDRLYVLVPGDADRGRAEIVARGRSVVEAGRLFIDRENRDQARRSQSLIVASPTEVRVEDRVGVEWKPGTPVTSTPVTTTPETPAPPRPQPAVPPRGELADTGADVAIAVGVGALLVGGGATALIVQRRRRGVAQDA